MAATGKKAKPEIQNWYKDRYQYVVMQRKVLVIISVAALVCTFAAIFIIFRLIDAKTIEPFVIQIDQRSGITQVLDPVSVKELTAKESVNNHFISQYIKAREGYHARDISRDYDLVRLMSDPGGVFGYYRGSINPNNPSSPVARFGSSGERTVKIKSITYLEPRRVQVRIQIDESMGEYSGTLHRIATLSFTYVRLNLSISERYINPLGFRVTEYRVYEDEAVQ